MSFADKYRKALIISVTGRAFLRPQEDLRLVGVLSQWWRDARAEELIIRAVPFSTLYEKCVGSLASPANQYRDVGDWAYGLSSLPAKARKSNLFANVIAKAAYSHQLF